jgi:virginiamycin B lyase
VVDNNGSLWVTDHGTSLFYKLNPITGNITQFSTSQISPRIFGVMSNFTPVGAYTLPYWIKKGSDDSIWFNEHTGNKIARFDLSNLTLTEYWIPSQNKLWGQCPVLDKECGIANALQFSLGEQGNQLWFTEWSENKIAKLTTTKALPIAVSASPSEITVRRGESAEIKVYVKTVSSMTVDMVAAGPFTRNGGLGNSSGTFSEQTYLARAGNSKEVSYIFTPSSDLVSGQYMLMLGADVNPVTLLKAVKVNIV